MAKKFNYQMKTITIDEAMEILGFTNVDKFVAAVDKHLPTHSIDGEVDMYSISEVNAMAKSMDKEISIPSDIKQRCVEYEQDVPKNKTEEETIKRRLDHPYMEGSKCIENCFHKDEYGFCKAGDRCIIYDVNTAPEKNSVAVMRENIATKKANEFEQKRQAAENVYNDGTAKISAVQDILMKQLYAMTAPDLTMEERESAIKTGLAVSNVSKTVLTSFGLQLHSFELAAQYGIDKKGIKKLI